MKKTSMQAIQFDNPQIIIQTIRAGLWLPIIQTILWLMHGGRDGLFQNWAQSALGTEGNSAFWVLAILWLCLALPCYRS